MGAVFEGGWRKAPKKKGKNIVRAGVKTIDREFFSEG